MKNKGVVGFGLVSALPELGDTPANRFLEASGAVTHLFPHKISIDIASKDADITWMGLDGSLLGTTRIGKVAALNGLVKSLRVLDRFAFLRMLVERLSNQELQLLISECTRLRESRENANTVLPELGAAKLGNLTSPTTPPVNSFDGEEDEEDKEDELPDEYEDDEDDEDHEDDDEDDEDAAPFTKAPTPPVAVFPIPTTTSKKPGKVSGLKAVKSKPADRVPPLPGNKGTKYNWADSVSSVFDGAPDESDTVTPVAPATEVKPLRSGKPRGKAR